MRSGSEAEGQPGSLFHREVLRVCVKLTRPYPWRVINGWRDFFTLKETSAELNFVPVVLFFRPSRNHDLKSWPNGKTCIINQQINTVVIWNGNTCWNYFLHVQMYHIVPSTHKTPKTGNGCYFVVQSSAFTRDVANRLNSTIVMKVKQVHT